MNNVILEQSEEKIKPIPEEMDTACLLAFISEEIAVLKTQIELLILERNHAMCECEELRAELACIRQVLEEAEGKGGM